jgi:hypothetical protein
MTVLGTHRGPVSGITHIHLLRESAAIRTARSAGQPIVAGPGQGHVEGAKPAPDEPLPVAATRGGKPGR